jgi:nitrate reductase cytochrome c-type subunit
MSESIIVALITGAVSLAGTILTVWATSSKTQHKIDVQQARFEEQLKELTREVRKHNNFAERMPVVEHEIESINKTVDKLQTFHMQ